MLLEVRITRIEGLVRVLAIDPLAPAPVETHLGSQHGRGAPEDLQIVLRPVGIAEEGEVRPAQQPEIDAQAAGAAALEDDLGVPLPDAVENPIVTLVVLVESISRLVPMIGAVAPGAGIEVEVELDPIEGVGGD